MPTKSDRRQNSNSACGSRMEIQTMVSNIIGHPDKSASGFSLSSSSLGQSTTHSSQLSQLLVNRVAAIRQPLFSQNIPERMSKVLFAYGKVGLKNSKNQHGNNSVPSVIKIG